LTHFLDKIENADSGRSGSVTGCVAPATIKRSKRYAIRLLNNADRATVGQRNRPGDDNLLSVRARWSEIHPADNYERIPAGTGQNWPPSRPESVPQGGGKFDISASRRAKHWQYYNGPDLPATPV
jgi:hypothetical protein